MKNFFKNKKILITGGTGYIGSKLINNLIKLDSKIFLLIRKKKITTNYYLNNKNITILYGNILDNNFWKKNIANKDYLIHLASNESKFGVDINFLENFDINVKSLILALFYSYKYNKKIKIVSIGSENQVGIPKKIPVNENFKDIPETFFGLNKLIAEKYLDFYRKNLKIKSITLRLSNIYGPSEFAGKFLNVSLNKMINHGVHSKIYLYSNKNSVRDFIFIDDVINAILLAAQNIKKFDKNFYYIGSGKGITLEQVGKVIENVVKKRIPNKRIVKVIKNKILTNFDKRNFVADIKNFKKITGWSPKINIEKGINQTLEYILKNKIYIK